MFHHDWIHLMAEKQRREQEIARIQRRRQEDELLSGAPRPPKLYHRLLAYLGRKLVDLGWHLQTPYNRTVAPPRIGSRTADPQLRLNC